MLKRVDKFGPSELCKSKAELKRLEAMRREPYRVGQLSRIANDVWERAHIQTQSR